MILVHIFLKCLPALLESNEMIQESKYRAAVRIAVKHCLLLLTHATFQENIFLWKSKQIVMFISKNIARKHSR